MLRCAILLEKFAAHGQSLSADVVDGQHAEGIREAGSRVPLPLEFPRSDGAPGAARRLWMGLDQYAKHGRAANATPARPQTART